MPVKTNKSPFCIDCSKEFDSLNKYCSLDRCNICYQKFYKNLHKKEKTIYTACVDCGREFGSYNEKGKLVKLAHSGSCSKCYTSRFSIKKCKSCSNEMIKGSSTGLCPVCKLEKMSRKKQKKEKKLNYVEYDDFELIRRLLTKYKLGMNTMADAFRVIDVYMEVNDNPILLDTLSEESQLVEMLRNLKLTFDYNLELRTNNIKGKVNKKEVKPPKKNKKDKSKNMTADMKAYRRNYYYLTKEKKKRYEAERTK